MCRKFIAYLFSYWWILIPLIAVGLAVFFFYHLWARSEGHQLEYWQYADQRFFMNIALAVLAVLCFLFLNSKQAFKNPRAGKALGHCTHGIVFFWTVCIPIWFFFEYTFFIKDVRLPSYVRNAPLEDVRVLADLASKIWAGCLLLGGLALKERRDERQDESQDVVPRGNDLSA